MTVRGFKYVTTGKLTGVVNDVKAAQAYLVEEDMTQHLDVAPAVIDIRWNLEDDGQSYTVTALAYQELLPYELDQLAMWVNGQNSDGLGEGFEQQDFAEMPEEEGYAEGDEIMDDCYSMYVSFDWKSNPNKFVQVERFQTVGA